MRSIRKTFRCLGVVAAMTGSVMAYAQDSEDPDLTTFSLSRRVRRGILRWHGQTCLIRLRWRLHSALREPRLSTDRSISLADKGRWRRGEDLFIHKNREKARTNLCVGSRRYWTRRASGVFIHQYRQFGCSIRPARLGRQSRQPGLRGESQVWERHEELRI